jgi:predicted enzyme involved in methoxymalonyl-ACP biosynthesis
MCMSNIDFKNYIVSNVHPDGSIGASQEMKGYYLKKHIDRMNLQGIMVMVESTNDKDDVSEIYDAMKDIPIQTEF